MPDGQMDGQTGQPGWTHFFQIYPVVTCYYLCHMPLQTNRQTARERDSDRQTERNEETDRHRDRGTRRGHFGWLSLTDRQTEKNLTASNRHTELKCRSKHTWGLSTILFKFAFKWSITSHVCQLSLCVTSHRSTSSRNSHSIPISTHSSSSHVVLYLTESNASNRSVTLSFVFLFTIWKSSKCVLLCKSASYLHSTRFHSEKFVSWDNGPHFQNLLGPSWKMMGQAFRELIF